MILPGGFIQPGDLDHTMTVNGIVIGNWTHIAAGEPGYIAVQVNVPNLSPWQHSPFRYYENTKNKFIQTENLYSIIRRFNGMQKYWYAANEENIKARIQSDWAQYTLPTVYGVNDFLIMTFSKKKERYAFLRDNARSPWCWCKYSNLFIPKKLKVSKYIQNLSQFKPAFYMYGVAPEHIIEQLRARNVRDTSISMLHNYSDRATNYFSFLTSKTDPSETFYGIELEYEGRTNDNVTKTTQLLQKYAILKRDGSLRNGFEICTAPAHFNVHKEQLVEFFKHCSALGLRADTNTGMHVHISKGPMSFLQLGKIFAMLNNAENEDLLVKIAGRSQNNFCRPDHHRNHKISVPFTQPDTQGHYSRLNLANRDTIEVRMFSTPMTYDDCMHKLEFCKALVDITAPAAVAVSSIKEFEKISLMQQYVSRNHKQYPHLSKLIGV